MEQGKFVLPLIKDRIKSFTQLKDLLLQQQKALVNSDTDQITISSELQIDCMEKIQELENKWQKLIIDIKSRHNLQTAEADYVISLALNDEDSDRVFAYLGQIKRLIGEIETTKRNNTLLINNSLSIIRSTIKHLQGDRAVDAVYHPFRKQINNYALLNKKL